MTLGLKNKSVVDTLGIFHPAYTTLIGSLSAEITKYYGTRDTLGYVSTWEALVWRSRSIPVDFCKAGSTRFIRVYFEADWTESLLSAQVVKQAGGCLDIEISSEKTLNSGYLYYNHFKRLQHIPVVDAFLKIWDKPKYTEQTKDLLKAINNIYDFLDSSEVNEETLRLRRHLIPSLELSKVQGPPELKWKPQKKKNLSINRYLSRVCGIKDDKLLSLIDQWKVKTLAEHYTDTEFTVKFFKGTDIVDWYSKFDGTLYSCMTGRDRSWLVEFYAENPHLFALAILFNSSNTPVARCIVWNLPHGVYYDRTYPASIGRFNRLLEAKLKEKGIRPKSDLSSLADNPQTKESSKELQEIIDKLGLKNEDQDLNIWNALLSFEVKAYLPQYCQTQYFDSFAYIRLLGWDEGKKRQTIGVLPLTPNNHPSCYGKFQLSSEYISNGGNTNSGGWWYLGGHPQDRITNKPKTLPYCFITGYPVISPEQVVVFSAVGLGMVGVTSKAIARDIFNLRIRNEFNFGCAWASDTEKSLDQLKEDYNNYFIKNPQYRYNLTHCQIEKKITYNYVQESPKITHKETVKEVLEIQEEGAVYAG